MRYKYFCFLGFVWLLTVPLFAAEPTGIRLIDRSGSSAPFLLLWKTTQHDTYQQMDAAKSPYRLSEEFKKFFREPLVSCSPSEGNAKVTICAMEFWCVDFGSRFYGFVLGFYKDQFYHVQAFIPEADFLFVLQTLADNLGKPTKDDASTVQNRAGATFDQRKLTWELPDVSITLEKRGDKVNQGSLVFQLRSLAEQAAKEWNKDGKVPF